MMDKKNSLDKIAGVLLLTVALATSLMQVKEGVPLLHYIFYSYDKVQAKITSYQNQDAAGYFSSKANIAYNYENNLYTAPIELIGFTLENNRDSIEVYISKKNNHILTTNTNLLYTSASICITLFISIFWFFSLLKLISIFRLKTDAKK